MRRVTTCALAVMLLLAGCASGPGVGSAAPDFAAEDAHGKPITLAAYEGSVLILDFWAVW